MIDQFLEERAAELVFISTSFGIDELKNKERLPMIFYNLQAGSKAFADIGLFDEKRKVFKTALAGQYLYS